MAQLLNGGFNAQNVNPEQGGSSLPPAKKQLMMIFDSEIVGSKGNSNNGMLRIHVRYLDGPNAGAEGQNNYNLYNSNPDAVRIAERDLSALCHVIGKPGFGDSAELHNIQFRADVDYQPGHDPASGNADAKGYTQFGKVYDINGNKPKAGVFGPQNAPQGNNGGGYNPNAGQGQQQGNPQQGQQQQAGNGSQGGWQNSGNGANGQQQNQQQAQPQGNNGWNNNGGNQQQQNTQQQQGGGNNGWNGSGNNGGGNAGSWK